MRGSPLGLAEYLIKQPEINKIGHSKHTAKQAARRELHQAGQSASWSNVAQKIGIYSHKTLKTYREIWTDYLKWSRDYEKIKDPEKLTSEHVKKYIQFKADSGLKRQTLRQHCAALAKMDFALTIFCQKIRGGRDIEWSQGLKAAREIANALDKSDPHRAYTQPEKLINALDGKYKLAAKLQLEGGLRIREMALIKPGQLKEKEIKNTGARRGNISRSKIKDIYDNVKQWVQEKGNLIVSKIKEKCGIKVNKARQDKKENTIKVRGKGGKFRDIKLSKETYQQLKNIVKNEGAWALGNKDKYREALKKAAERTGQEYTGSHGLRWNFAQTKMGEVQAAGASFEQALAVVSAEMGHNRAEITMHYLR